MITFWAILQKLHLNGMTIMVSTPYMDEASLCGRIALMQDGKILSINSPKEIEEQNKNKVFTINSANNYRLLEDLRKRNDVTSCYMFGDALHLTFKDNTIPENLSIDGIKIAEISPTIEDCFIELMKNNK